MANLAASDVTYVNKSVYSDQVGDLPTRRKALIQVTFGDGSKTYPTNGVPFTTAGLGMTNFVEWAVVVDTSGASQTHLVSYDIVHNTLRMYSAEGTEFVGGSTAVTAAQVYILHVVGF